MDMNRLKIVTLGLIVSLSTFGQVINVHSGISISNLDWQYGSESYEFYNKRLVGYSMFVGLEYLNKKYYNLSTNIGFVRKGDKRRLDLETTGYWITKATLNYLSINTAIDLKFPIREKVIPFLTVGPRFDYLINYNDEIELWDEIDAVNDFNIGLILGGGMKYDFNKFIVGLQAIYYLNFYKVIEWPTQPDFPEGSSKDHTSTIFISIGYKL